MKYDPLDIADYIFYIVDEFAACFNLNELQAFRYLKNHGGINFIEQNYGVMHTLDDKDSVESIALFCKRNGGLL